MVRQLWGTPPFDDESNLSDISLYSPAFLRRISFSFRESGKLLRQMSGKFRFADEKFIKHLRSGCIQGRIIRNGKTLVSGCPGKTQLFHLLKSKGG